MPLHKLVARRLSPTEIDELIAELVKDTRELPGIRKVIIFGSAARGTMSEASDLDAVLIFANSKAAKSALKQIHVNRKSHWPTDFICVDENTYRIKSQIGGVFFSAREEGRAVFESEKP